MERLDAHHFAAGSHPVLADWGKGDRSALDKLFPLVHAELRRIARRQMSQERDGHTLQATALVNEAYLKLAGQQEFEWQNRGHFFAVCAQVMRRSLERVDAQKSKIVELRYFGGLNIEETAEVLDLSPRTVRREWQRSKAWLYRMITEGTADETRPLARG